MFCEAAFSCSADCPTCSTASTIWKSVSLRPVMALSKPSFTTRKSPRYSPFRVAVISFLPRASMACAMLFNGVMTASRVLLTPSTTLR